MNKVLDFTKIKEERDSETFVDNCINALAFEAFIDIAEEMNFALSVLKDSKIKPDHFFDNAIQSHDYAELDYAAFSFKLQGQNLINLGESLQAAIPSHEKSPKYKAEYDDLIENSSQQYKQKTTPIILRYLDELIKQMEPGECIYETLNDKTRRY